ncbi:tetratricopeptide repeat protein [Asticcacaulis sp. YBE204]|uniref:tetratricopeptide repeat protein n=1 Tax=Asticcacaulis sp. YBE204 TaxID=1282363 RepID=UPI0004CFD230|nr:tetratricopeptide repeat protein [Asticcacaulis sp. YBE204]
MFETTEIAAREFDRLMQDGDHDAAIVHIDQALKLYPNDEWLFFRRCKHQEIAGSTQDAEATWRQYVEKFPDSVSGYRELGRWLADQQRFDEAESLLERTTARFPDDAWAGTAYARVAEITEKWAIAEARFQALAARFPEHHFAHEGWLRSLLGQKKTNDAENLAQACRTEFPAVRFFSQIWADIPMLRFNRYASAQRWEQLWESAPEWVDAADIGSQRYIETLCYYDAQKLCEAALQKAPDNGPLLTRLIDTKLLNRDFSGLEVLLKSWPDNDEQKISALFSALDIARSYEELTRLYTQHLQPLEIPEAALSGAAENRLRHQGPIEASLIDTLTSFDMAEPLWQALLRLRSDTGLDLPQGRVVLPPKTESASASAFERRVGKVFRQFNAWVGDRTLRQYQADLFTSGGISRFGTFLHDYALKGSMAFGHSSTAYAFCKSDDIVWAMTSGHGSGNSIDALYFTATRLLVVTNEAYLGFFESNLSFFDQVSITDIQGSTADAPILLIGHNNYAHFMWNELPGLLLLKTLNPIPTLKQALLYEPYGPQEWLFGTALKERPAHTTFSPELYFYASAIVVSAEAKAEIIRLSELNSSSLEPVPQASLRLWISLRLMYRHAVNQLDYLLALAQEVNDRGIDCDLMLDGLSLPWDIDIGDRYPGTDKLRQNGDDVSRLALSLIEKLNARNLSHIKVYDYTASDLCTATVAAGYANAYICNQGTQQHKIGWIHDRPGLIHTNKMFSMTAPSGEWVQTQCDGRSEAVVMPEYLIADCDSGNERQDLPAFRDYAFADPVEAAKWSVDMLIHLSNLAT